MFNKLNHSPERALRNVLIGIKSGKGNRRIGHSKDSEFKDRHLNSGFFANDEAYVIN